MKLANASDNLFNVIIKTTNYCCLNCDYCYMESHQCQQKNTVISLETITKLIKDYISLISKNSNATYNDKIIKLTWHGGEPLLAGIEFFKNVIEIQNELIPSSFKVVNSITTNAVEINDEWIRFFEKENFQVGISLDGPKHLHNIHRKDRNNNGSYDRVMDAIKLVQKSNIPFGTLTVITPELAKSSRDVFNFLISNNIKSVNFIPYTSPTNSLSNEEYTNFLTSFFDLWFELDDPSFYVRDFANIIPRIFGRESSLCEYTNCFGNYLGLDTNGDVYMCDLLIGNQTFLMGNIHNQSLEEVMNSSSYEQLKLSARQNSPSCQKCEFFSICTGGCMYRRFLNNNMFPGKDIYCLSKRDLITHIMLRLNEVEKRCV